MPVGLAVSDHFINRGGTETLTRIGVFLRATGDADIGVKHVQMGRLIFVVCDRGMIYIGNFVESEFAVKA